LPPQWSSNERRGGITPADLAAATADRTAFTRIDGVVDAKVVGPISAKDNQALELLVPIKMGTQGGRPSPPRSVT
jgi:RND superfamily putative drug exporter